VIALGVAHDGMTVFADYDCRLFIVRSAGNVVQLQNTPIIVATCAANRMF
jgi:hypothetical protein